MVFKFGKFYDNLGNAVPLEHGNKEQIKILENIESLKDGVIFDFTSHHHKLDKEFTCLCGYSWHPQFEDQKIITCGQCQQTYQFYLHNDDYMPDIPCIRGIFPEQKKKVRRVKHG